MAAKNYHCHQDCLYLSVAPLTGIHQNYSLRFPQKLRKLLACQHIYSKLMNICLNPLDFHLLSIIVASRRVEKRKNSSFLL